jgi:hypothetical protein
MPLRHFSDYKILTFGRHVSTNQIDSLIRKYKLGVIARIEMYEYLYAVSHALPIPVHAENQPFVLVKDYGLLGCGTKFSIRSRPVCQIDCEVE